MIKKQTYILGNRFLEALISLHGKILFLALIISAQNIGGVSLVIQILQDT